MARFSPEEHPDSICHSEVNKNHHYLIQPIGQNFVVALSSKKKLDQIELTNLVTNISHVYLKPDSVKIKLGDIIANPLAYTGKDLMISVTQKKTCSTIAYCAIIILIEI